MFSLFHILMLYNMIIFVYLIFRPLIVFLFSIYYFSTLILYRRYLDTFYLAIHFYKVVFFYENELRNAKITTKWSIMHISNKTEQYVPLAYLKCSYEIAEARVLIYFSRHLNYIPLSEARLFAVLVDRTLRNKLQWIFNQNTKLLFYANASENTVCEMVAILSRGRWVKWHWYNI